MKFENSGRSKTSIATGVIALIFLSLGLLMIFIVSMIGINLLTIILMMNIWEVHRL